MSSLEKCLFRFSSHLGPNLKVKVKSLCRVWLFATPWTVACQAPPSMGFSRQEYWRGLPFSSPGDLPDPGIEPRSTCTAGRLFTVWATREAHEGKSGQQLVCVLSILFYKYFCCCSVTESCLPLCDPMDCNSPGFSIHGILQARILEWVAISFFKGSSQPWDGTGSPTLQADALTSEIKNNIECQ